VLLCVERYATAHPAVVGHVVSLVQGDIATSLEIGARGAICNLTDPFLRGVVPSWPSENEAVTRGKVARTAWFSLGRLREPLDHEMRVVADALVERRPSMEIRLADLPVQTRSMR
jgi:hypothetical protein